MRPHGTRLTASIPPLLSCPPCPSLCPAADCLVAADNVSSVVAALYGSSDSGDFTRLLNAQGAPERHSLGVPGCCTASLSVLYCIDCVCVLGSTAQHDHCLVACTGQMEMLVWHSSSLAVLAPHLLPVRGVVETECACQRWLLPHLQVCPPREPLPCMSAQARPTLSCASRGLSRPAGRAQRPLATAAAAAAALG